VYEIESIIRRIAKLGSDINRATIERTKSRSNNNSEKEALRSELVAKKLRWKLLGDDVWIAT